MSVADGPLGRAARRAGALCAASLLGVVSGAPTVSASILAALLARAPAPAHHPRTAARTPSLSPASDSSRSAPAPHYTLPLAEWITEGQLDILDIHKAMFHTRCTGPAHGLQNITPARADAQHLPYADGTFDAVVLVTTLGEIPD